MSAVQMFPPFQSKSQPAFYGLSDFAKAVAAKFHSAARVQKIGAPYDNILFTPEQVLAFYRNYETHLCCYWAEDGSGLSPRTFYLIFFERGNLQSCIEFIGAFRFESAGVLAEELDNQGYRPEELGISGLFQRCFVGNHKCCSNTAFTEKQIEQANYKPVTPDELQTVLNGRIAA